MTPTSQTARARRYLLGAATDEESAAIEREYLEHEEAVDRMAAAEDDLVEDYIADELTPAERQQFERSYLSAPHHRVRVDTVRRLMVVAARSAPESTKKATVLTSPRFARKGGWLAVAASLIVAVSLSMWVLSRPGPQVEIVDNRPQPPATGAGREPTARSEPAPAIFALTLAPAGVRSATDDPSVVIPVATEVVAIRLERDAGGRTLTPARASIRSVGGGEIWQGVVTVESDPQPGIVGRVEVPAAALPPDDYLLTLYGTNEAGVEQEWAQYFMRVRMP
jgi:hypothetical protein